MEAIAPRDPSHRLLVVPANFLQPPGTPIRLSVTRALLVTTVLMHHCHTLSYVLLVTIVHLERAHTPCSVAQVLCVPKEATRKR